MEQKYKFSSKRTVVLVVVIGAIVFAGIIATALVPDDSVDTTAPYQNYSVDTTAPYQNYSVDTTAPYQNYSVDTTAPYQNYSVDTTAPYQNYSVDTTAPYQNYSVDTTAPYQNYSVDTTAPVPDNSVDTLSQDYLRYENISYGVSISYPNDWIYENQPNPVDYPLVDFFSPEDVIYSAVDILIDNPSDTRYWKIILPKP